MGQCEIRTSDIPRFSNFSKTQKKASTINKILKKEYNTYYCNKSNLVDDCRCVFEKLKSKNKKLSENEVTELLTKICKKKSKSILRKNTDDTILIVVIENCALTNTHVDIIFKCLNGINYDSSTFSFEWLDKLTTSGYKFTTKQKSYMEKHNYKDGIDALLKNDTATLNDLKIICSRKKLDINKLDKFLTKFKVIPTHEIVADIVKNNDNKNLLLKYIKNLIKHNLKPSIDVLKECGSIIFFKDIDEYVDNVFKNTNLDLSVYFS